MADLVAAKYHLVLVRADGPRTGSHVAGHIWLRPFPGHWSGTNLYGYTDADFDDFEGVGRTGKDVLAPSSTDPDRPGVLVSQGSRGGRPPALTIGTASNSRPRVITAPDGSRRETVILDGGGLLLEVYRATPEGFDGRWGRWGIQATGSGYFCATRIQDDSR